MGACSSTSNNKKQKNLSSSEPVYNQNNQKPKESLSSLPKPPDIRAQSKPEENPIILEQKPSEPMENRSQLQNRSTQKKLTVEEANDFRKVVETLKTLVGVSEGMHMGITCGSCKSKNFKGYRYKCLKCSNFDLCDLCFEKKRTSQNHVNSHPMLLIQDPTLNYKLESLVAAGLGKVNEICLEKKIIHEGSDCKSCQIKNIPGIRFLCDECLSYNLCYSCFSLQKQTEKHLMSHPMIVFVSQVNYVIPFKEIQWGEKLGEGSFGQAFKATWRGKTIACKKLDFSLDEERDEEEKEFLEQQIQSFHNENKIYKELCSQHIVRYIGESKEDDFRINTVGDSNLIASKMVICLEYMENQTVKHKILKEKVDLSLRKRFQMCLSLSSGLRRIHSKKIIHKDLKPDNIFLTKDFDLKIGDLGLAYNKKVAFHLKEMKQDLYYPPDEKPSQSGDIYSMGLIINEIFTSIRHKTATLYDVEPKSDYFFDVIRKCLDKDVEKRPLAEQIENRMLLFDDFFWLFIKENKVNYTMKMQTNEKNKVFSQIYNAFLSKFGEF